MEARPATPRVLVAACGSLSVTKYGALCRTFSEWTETVGVLTEPAINLLDRATLPKTINYYVDQMELSTWKKMGDPVLHNQLQEWADYMVIAPLTANTLAKMAAGVCDNLLTCIIRAWDYNKPVFISPSMSLTQWNHPLTEQHLMAVEEFGSVMFVPSDPGVMAEPSVIFSNVVAYFRTHELNRG